MKFTYNDILSKMKNVYLKNCGKNVYDNSELDLRFKAVASEIFSVASYCEYVIKQGFVQTATNENLDNHAMLRDIKRKVPQKAKGILTFYLKEVYQSDVLVPKGTICSVKDFPFIQYETLNDGIIKRGNLEVDVNAQALDYGFNFNVEKNKITTIVNKPQFVDSVNNKSEFTSGENGESDDALRKRILSSYSARKNGLNKNSIKEAILSIKEIEDANVILNDDGVFKIYLLTTKENQNRKLEEQIEELIGFLKFYNLPFEYIYSKGKKFTVYVNAKLLNEKSKEDTIEKIKKAVLGVCSREIGKSISTNDISKELFKIDNLENFEVDISDNINNVFYTLEDEYPLISNIEVNIYE